MNPKFSIIVPLFNKAPYVKKSLDSIMSQTYNEWECIIVDDGSTDNSADIVRELINGKWKMVNDQFRLISQSNAGVAAARNNGVAESKGEYLCFLDADDWLEANFLEEMDKLIKEYPDAGLYASNYVYHKPGKTHVALKLNRGYMNYPEAYLNGPMPVISSAVCMSRYVFSDMGGFPLGIKLGEDFLLWAKIALRYQVAFCEKPLAYYNNDVPAHLRATRNLHAPQYNMFFQLDEIERESRVKSRESREVWKALLDWQRVNGLYDYWLSDEYHDVAEAELNKVDWSKQPNSAKAQYEKPIWLLKIKRRIMQIGSYIKQRLIKMIK